MLAYPRFSQPIEMSMMHLAAGSTSLVMTLSPRATMHTRVYLLFGRGGGTLGGHGFLLG